VDQRDISILNTYIVLLVYSRSYTFLCELFYTISLRKTILHCFVCLFLSGQLAHVLWFICNVHHFLGVGQTRRSRERESAPAALWFHAVELKPTSTCIVHTTCLACICPINAVSIEVYDGS
jgi:hypothetical protein